MKTILICLSLLYTIGVLAQPANEKKAVESLCGCYEVDFMYAETFSPNEEYEFPKRYHAKGLELVLPIENADNKIMLQHLLVIDDTTIIKHWREDWEYEKKDWWAFNHDASWKYITATKPVQGEWTQTVWEVDDAPRYQGSSKWVENNNKYYWENTADAPLPRREYSKRSDYNVLKRTNRIILTDTGWVHEQDNDKIIRKDGAADILLAREKGMNIYRKTDDAKCAIAAQWWVAHKDFWVTVRDSWAALMKGKQFIRLNTKVDEQRLYEQLYKLEAKKLSGEVLKQEVNALLAKYHQPDKDAAAVR
jgi:hypothetical protein